VNASSSPAAADATDGGGAGPAAGEARGASDGSEATGVDGARRADAGSMMWAGG